jgi:hypothetical protein
MTRGQMETFLQRLIRGENANGSRNSILYRFNRAVERQCIRPVRIPPLETRQQWGASYLQSSGRLSGLILMAGLWDLMDNVGILEVAGSTEGQQMFRRAVQALAEGRPGCVAVANRALFGRSDYPQGGIFALLLRRGYERAALRFQTAWFEAVRRAMEREEAERRRP